MQPESYEPDTKPLDGLLGQAVERVRSQPPPREVVDRSLQRARGIAAHAAGRQRRQTLWGAAAMAAAVLLTVSLWHFASPHGGLLAPSPALQVADNSESNFPAQEPPIVDFNELDALGWHPPGRELVFRGRSSRMHTQVMIATAGGLPQPQGGQAAPGPHPELADSREAGDNTEQYLHLPSNPFLRAAVEPLSTFSTDVDTASYSLVRRFLKTEHRLPPADAVRIEELVNYFEYDYPQPQGEHPISITPEVAACPWNKDHRLVRIGLQARNIRKEELPPRNLVFLIDVSGSMNESNRLPLVKEALGLLIDQLTARDRVAIVVYAGEAGVWLRSTPGSEKELIRDAVNRLGAGGSTNGAGGIIAAYEEAHRNFIKEGVNRVILATDGDFNVGITSQGDLVRLIEEHRNKGIYLTCLGFGMGNLKDSTIMKLANHGHGHYAYIDSLDEAKKVFVDDGMALVALAQDVKVQVEFNPKRVEAYRLIGYEKRLMAHQDFNDDTKHAAVLGCGHRVTVLYEIVPAGKPADVPAVDPLRYQEPARPTRAADSSELLAVKIRYKEPMAEKSKLLEVPVPDSARGFDAASADFRFAAAVAAFGRILRDNPKNAGINLAGVRELAQSAQGADLRGRRAEFIDLVKTAEKLMK